MRTRLAVIAATACLPVLVAGQATAEPAYEFNDAHFHLTNYVQQGPDIHRFLEIMGDKVGRVALFGIPLQQTWSYENSGNYAPTYYLQTDAPLYYYSFTDAWIASQYLSLKPADRARFDPMITGFNPADMYGVEHIKRVLTTFPGVFTGIGEFTIHKEFVSSKVAGDTASLTDPALDRIFDFCAESGLIAILHNDIDMPFAKQGAEPVYLTQAKDLLRRHPGATIIWAHVGIGRVVHPVQSVAAAGGAERPVGHMDIVKAMLEDPALKHLYFDISWDEVAKYAVATPEATQRTASIINRYPDRFLFGTDEVAPGDQKKYLKVYYMYDPVWQLLTPEAREKVRKGNYERLFDAARKKVRAWEAANIGDKAN
ncbi:MAG: amidohydrolase family protein [Gammaproteobacteria bacterium]|nr:amidohydrolase family protein [Gammaproteobacteria bacterium]